MAGEHVPQKTEVGRKAAETMDECLDTGDRVDHVQGGYKNDENQPSKVINSNLDRSQATDLDIPQLKGKRLPTPWMLPRAFCVSYNLSDHTLNGSLFILYCR